ncbi:carboxymuconolactone decarboxylase family protein [Aminipila terrae]|uniref:Carboxymuconolactone decarboxylase family protein n=1 Tax=Aminipila terrae TaxID=2697030 RepID=A0A6P1MHR2_9FIRM|nr:carboxymuconolactone decarboxylase family protein [Aminipila terrae]QHI72134.1 carboxymuconolactone decarboxylase family protein [Aminipila terrae]
MAKIKYSTNGVTPFQQLLGHNKSILEKWSSLEECLFSSDTFNEELKEQVRRALAFENGCQYCMAKGKPLEDMPDLKVRLASDMAHMATGKSKMDDKFFEKMKGEFTDSELSELMALICFITASQKFGALLGLEAGCSI